MVCSESPRTRAFAATTLALVCSIIGAAYASPTAASAVEDASVATGERSAGGDDARRICNPDPPEYPGCTQQQINSWEVGTVDKTWSHYRQDRWGQAGYNWSNLGPAHDDKLRRLYADAVDEYQDKHAKANPAFLTWNGAKAGTECSAGGIWGGLYTLNCRFKQAMDAVIPDVTKAAIYCAGLSVVLTGASIVLTLIAPESVPLTLAGGAILCAIEKLYAKVFGGGKMSSLDRGVAKAAVRARLTVLGALEALPFGSASRLTPEQRLLAQLNRAAAARLAS